MFCIRGGGFSIRRKGLKPDWRPIEFPGNAQPTDHCSPRAGKVPAPVSIQEMVDLEHPQQRSKWGTWALRMSCPWKVSRKQTHEHELPMMIVLVKVNDCFFWFTFTYLWIFSSGIPVLLSHPSFIRIQGTWPAALASYGSHHRRSAALSLDLPNVVGRQGCVTKYGHFRSQYILTMNVCKVFLLGIYPHMFPNITQYENYKKNPTQYTQ